MIYTTQILLFSLLVSMAYIAANEIRLFSAASTEASKNGKTTKISIMISNLYTVFLRKTSLLCTMYKSMVFLKYGLNNRIHRRRNDLCVLCRSVFCESLRSVLWEDACYGQS